MSAGRPAGRRDNGTVVDDDDDDDDDVSSFTQLVYTLNTSYLYLLV